MVVYQHIIGEVICNWVISEYINDHRLSSQLVILVPARKLFGSNKNHAVQSMRGGTSSGKFLRVQESEDKFGHRTGRLELN